MKLTVLVDNNSIIDRYLLAEPGLSFLIEDHDKKILFDTGYSDVFIVNSRKLNLSLADLNFVVISHSHLDHTWGLEPYIKYLSELKTEKIPHNMPTFVSHPAALTSVSATGFAEFGPLLSKDKLSKHFKLKLTSEPVKLSSRVTFLGGIPRQNTFESKISFGQKEGENTEDYVPEDSALVYQSSEGLVIITGCSHSGICNIVEYAKQVCGENRILDIIGGLHLLKPSAEQLDGTLAYLKNLKPESIHACHCTDLNSKIAISAVANLKEVGVGLSIKYPD